MAVVSLHHNQLRLQLRVFLPGLLPILQNRPCFFVGEIALKGQKSINHSVSVSPQSSERVFDRHLSSQLHLRTRNLAYRKFCGQPKLVSKATHQCPIASTHCQHPLSVPSEEWRHLQTKLGVAWHSDGFCTSRVNKIRDRNPQQSNFTGRIEVLVQERCCQMIQPIARL